MESPLFPPPFPESPLGPPEHSVAPLGQPSPLVEPLGMEGIVQTDPLVPQMGGPLVSNTGPATALPFPNPDPLCRMLDRLESSIEEPYMRSDAMTYFADPQARILDQLERSVTHEPPPLFPPGRDEMPPFPDITEAGVLSGSPVGEKPDASPDPPYHTPMAGEESWFPGYPSRPSANPLQPSTQGRSEIPRSKGYPPPTYRMRNHQTGLRNPTPLENTPPMSSEFNLDQYCEWLQRWVDSHDCPSCQYFEKEYNTNGEQEEGCCRYAFYQPSTDSDKTKDDGNDSREREQEW